jgi:hypothetical protein
MDEAPMPRLAPPGAGLPAPERLIARILFGLRRRTSDRTGSDSRFREQREAVRRLVAGLDDVSAARRILIARPRGLEDSSRYWSVWMTLDHLRIVHHEIARIIGELGKGTVPAGQASTAAVKPAAEVGREVVGAYEQSCDALLAAAAAVPELRTAVRFPHPWFGPLDAAGWHQLAAGHMGIHRVQIERIIAGLCRTVR